MQEQGPGGLLAFYQQVTGVAQTHAYSRAFFVIALICFAGACFALPALGEARVGLRPRGGALSRAAFPSRGQRAGGVSRRSERSTSR